MTRTDVETELIQFTSGFRRVYKYKQEFIPDHYITISKVIKTQLDSSTIEEFEIIMSESTTNIEGFDKELFIKLLMKEELKFNDGGKWYMKIRDIRTGGCDMGCWATSNPTLHSPDCYLRKNYGGAGNE